VIFVSYGAESHKKGQAEGITSSLFILQKCHLHLCGEKCDKKKSLSRTPQIFGPRFESSVKILRYRAREGTERERKPVEVEVEVGK
jgi:hypothetical protein